MIFGSTEIRLLPDSASPLRHYVCPFPGVAVPAARGPVSGGPVQGSHTSESQPTKVTSAPPNIYAVKTNAREHLKFIITFLSYALFRGCWMTFFLISFQPVHRNREGGEMVP